MKIITVNRSDAFGKAASVATQQNQLPVEWAMSTYAPGFPIQPFVSPRETQVPREIDYPISVNATLQPRTGYGLLDFRSIRDVYETMTEVRMPIATGIRHLTGFQPHLVDSEGNEVDDHPYKWMTISPDNAMPFDVWLTRFMKSSDIFDAGTFSIQRADGVTTALNYIDGSTLFIIVDEHGRIPQPRAYDPAVALTPEYAKKFVEYNRNHPGKLKPRLTKADTGQPMVLTPAFVQVIKGTPFAWYSSDEIWYKPRYTRFDAPYGETFIEMAWAWIMIIANITGFELAHYREGNMPEGWWEAPEGWTLDRIAAYEAAWNSRMSSGPTERMRSRFAMAGMKWHETKKADFPDRLYQKAFNNLVLTFGYPPSEFGEMSGKGLGGKDMGDMLQDKTFRDAIIPRKVYLENAFNNILRDDGVSDVRFELQLPGQSLNPEKERQGVYDGVAHGVFTPNDALGRLGFDPVSGSMSRNPETGEMIPDLSHIGNKHLIIAGTTIYVLEDMQTQGGIVVPPFGQKPGADVEEQLPLIPKPEQPVTQADFEQQRETVKEILSTGKLPNDGKTYSLPPVAQLPVTTKASQSLPPGVDDIQYNMGLKEEQEHSGTVGGDQSMIREIVLDHLREDPQYYTHLREVHDRATAEKRYEVKGTRVYSSETGKLVPGGEHKTKEQAEAHMRALYANVPDASKVVAITKIDLIKHCGVCPGDEEYFGAPVSNEVKFDLPIEHHANEADLIAMTPEGLTPRPALWKPEGGEMEGLRLLIGGPLYVRDEAVYLLDQSLGFGLVPVAYVTESNGEMGSVIFWSVGSSFAKAVDQYAPEWIERAAILDYISSQIDRNTGNWLTHPDEPGRMILIDNSLSFPVDSKIHTDSPFTSFTVGQPIGDESLMAIKAFIGDLATQRDLRDLVGNAAVENALACAQHLLDAQVITPLENPQYTNTTSETFVESPATDVEVGSHDA